MLVFLGMGHNPVEVGGHRGLDALAILAIAPNGAHRVHAKLEPYIRVLLEGTEQRATRVTRTNGWVSVWLEGVGVEMARTQLVVKIQARKV